MYLAVHSGDDDSVSDGPSTATADTPWFSRTVRSSQPVSRGVELNRDESSDSVAEQKHLTQGKGVEDGVQGLNRVSWGYKCGTGTETTILLRGGET